MLAYILALVVGLGSLAVYMAAFFFPEIHRKNDFIWSGLGLFYAWVLWVCAGRITGGLLLGQAASVVLLSWSVTQTLQLRRQLTPRQQQTELPSAEEVKNTVQEKVSNLSIPQRLSQLGDRLSSTATGVKDQIQQQVSAVTARQSDAAPSTTTPAPPSAQVQVIDNRTPIPEQPVDLPATTVSVTETVLDEEIEPALTEEEAIALAVENAQEHADTTELVRPHPPDPELVEAALRDAEEKSEEASPPKPE